jgi:hypothetical protein
MNAVNFFDDVEIRALFSETRIFKFKSRYQV